MSVVSVCHARQRPPPPIIMAAQFRAVFLEPEDAALAAVDESLEPYVSLLSIREVEYMAGVTATGSDEFASIWAAAVRPWKADEKAGIEKALGQLYSILGPYPTFAALEWRFVKNRRGFCGGMAYTRNTEVHFDEGVCERYADGLEDGDARARGNPLVGLLAHEQLHVLQRRDPKAAARFYLQLWGAGEDVRLVQPQRLTSCAWVDENQVTNPDAVVLDYLIHIPASNNAKPRWFWPRTVLDPAASALEASGGRPPFLGCALEMAPTPERPNEFVPVFHGSDGKQLDADASVAALQDPAAVPLYSSLDDLWSGPARALFPTGYHQDHPNEVSAYIFADLCKLALEDRGALSPELDEERKTVLRQLAPAFERWLQVGASL